MTSANEQANTAVHFIPDQFPLVISKAKHSIFQNMSDDIQKKLKTNLKI